MAGEVVSIRSARGSAQRSPRPAAVREGISHNLNGQRLGRKGRDTRDRIVAVTTELLSEPLEDGLITLSEVARRADIRMGTLYLYFADLTELVFAVLGQCSVDCAYRGLCGACRR